MITNMLRSLWLLLFALSCSAPAQVENVSIRSERIYSHAPGTTQLYWSTPGTITGQSVRFGLYLPPQFDGATPITWVLWLHGKQVSTAIPDQVITQQANQVIPSLNAAMTAGKIEQTGVVFPWGGWESWYNDSCNPAGSWPIETMLVEELVLDIEANVPTHGDREHRFIGGFSMGGHGALKFAAKNPSLFRAVLGAAAPKPDAATASWPPNELAGYEAAFCSSASNFEASAPETQYENNAATIRSLPMKTRMIVGGGDGTRFALSAFKAKLINVHGYVLNVDVEYKEWSGVGHQLGPLMNTDGGASWKFFGDLTP